MVNSLKPWLLAIRPKTLTATLAPVVIGITLASTHGRFHAGAAGAVLVSILLLQIATNLINDYCDWQKGADTEDRQGPVRVTQSGLISPGTTLFVSALLILLASLLGLYLIYRGGPGVLLTGIAGILAAILYTAGPCPLAYLGLGEVFVFLFFGLVAVSITYYVQALSLPLEVILAGISPGLLAIGILAVNNLRDRTEDAKHHKRTLAVRFGDRFARLEYLGAVLSAILIPPILAVYTQNGWGVISLLTLGFAVPCFKTVMTYQSPAELNPLIGKTGLLLVVNSVLVSLACYAASAL